MSDAKVSVIIPVYNVENYIEECLISVIKQTLQEIEIICVNDGTPDNSMQIVGKYAKEDERIRIVEKANGGLSTARNAGLQYAQGEYVYFLDSDDYLQEEALENLYRVASENDLDVLLFGAVTFYENDAVKKKFARRFEGYYHRQKEYVGVLEGGELFATLEQNGEYRTSACLQLLKRSFLVENNVWFYEGILHEDNLFSLQVILQAKRAMVVNYDYYMRRVRDESIMTKAKSVKSSWGYYICIREMLKFLENREFNSQTTESIHRIMMVMQRDAVVQIRGIQQEELQSCLNEVTSSAMEKLRYQMLVENVEILHNQRSLINRIINKLK